MRLRYAGTCARCGAAIDAGTLADYDRSARTVACVSCEPQQACAEPAAGSEPSEELPAPRDPITESAPSLEAVDGVAGASAAAEFQRRHEARQKRVQARHPRLGRFLLAAFDDPSSTTAWSKGAVGEEQLGQAFAKKAGDQLRVLNDRAIPKTRANIDHLVVCPSGVFVVDAKRYEDARPKLQVTGWPFGPRREWLYVGGRERTKLVEGMHKQLSLVRDALAHRPDVAVCGVLCFVDADWPVIGGSFTVRDVQVMWPKKLIAMLGEPGPLGVDEIADVQWELHEAFPRHRQSG